MRHGSGSSLPLPGCAPVIDVDAGVERLMGNRQLYLRALARFRHDYRDTGTAIRAALDAGDLTGAQRLAHTLKGAAGMIEASTLHACALAFEQALRHGGGDIDALSRDTGEALARVLHELDGMAPAADDAAPPAGPAAPGALVRLRAMLDIGDGAALELVAAARTELAAQLGEREYEGVRAAVLAFDYERALALFDRAEAAGE